MQDPRLVSLVSIYCLFPSKRDSLYFFSERLFYNYSTFLKEKGISVSVFLFSNLIEINEKTLALHDFDKLEPQMSETLIEEMTHNIFNYQLRNRDYGATKACEILMRYLKSNVFLRNFAIKVLAN